MLPFLLVRRDLRLILTSAALALALVGLTVALYGLDPWVTFSEVTTVQQREVLHSWTGLLGFLMPTLFMQGRSLGLPLAGAYALTEKQFCPWSRKGAKGGTTDTPAPNSRPIRLVVIASELQIAGAR